MALLLYYYRSRSSFWIEWSAKSKDTHFRSLFLGWGELYFLFSLFSLRDGTQRGGGICKRWQKHNMELGMKGKVTFSGRLLYHEVDGLWRFLYLEVDALRGKRLPLTILSGGKHWYALSMEVSMDKQVCEFVQLLNALSGGKHFL